MCRGPRDRNGVVTFYLVKKDIYYPRDMLVSNRFNGPSSKLLHTIIAVGDDVVTRGYCRIRGLAPLLDPVEGMLYGTKFPAVARGSPGNKPIGSGRERGHCASYRSGVRSFRESDVYPSACGAGGEGRAVSEKEGRRIIEQGFPGPVGLAMYSSAFFLMENLFTSAWVPTV